MADEQSPIRDVSGRRLTDIPLGRLVACAPGTSVRCAAERMAEGNVDSIVVQREDGAALGILTDSDLRRRVVAAGRGPETPVEAVMSTPLLTAPSSMLFYEALSLMLDRKIHHLVLAENERAVGVVSETELLATFGVGPGFVARRFKAASSVEELIEVRAGVPLMVQALLKSGVGAYDLARAITQTTDALVKRALSLAEAELGPPPLPYCWLALGSQGRSEQTFHTDQDHALVYTDPNADEAEPAAAYFRALAERVVDTLTRSGIPVCLGDVMATFPRWNQPLATWREHFSRWIERPSIEALLNASIFFDLRCVSGEPSLAEALQDQIARQAPHGRRFQFMLADQSRHNPPPLGVFGRFVVHKGGEHRGQLDLKIGGLAPVVDLIRLYALRHGVRQTNTIERLRELAKLGVLPAQTPGELVAAYEFILLLRIRQHLAQIADGRETDNYLNPNTLARGDRVLLKEYLAVVVEAKKALQSEFSTYLLE